MDINNHVSATQDIKKYIPTLPTKHLGSMTPIRIKILLFGIALSDLQGRTK